MTGRPLLLAPTTVDANDVIHEGLNSIGSICCERVCTVCRQELKLVDFEPYCAHMC